MSWIPLALDTELALILALLVLLDAVKRVPGSHTVFRRALFGRWHAAAETDGSRWMVPSPFAPVWLSVIASEVPVPDGKESTYYRTRYREVMRTVRALRLFGLSQLVCLIVLVPAAVATWSGLGLLLGVLLTLIQCVLIAMCAARGWTRMNGVRPGWRRVLSWLSPFSSAAAAQDLLQEALRDASGIVVAHLLLPDAEFRRWIRTRAYDALAGTSNLCITDVLGAEELRAIVEAVPPGDGGAVAFCPRCAQTWRRPAETCTTCDVRLAAVTP